ncbi:MAG TPA: FAD-dependent oxidoreductase, partial [Microlunatus sp.]|nr:FAD-dependent oxidoreductase [Microlunatus sp.]
MTPTSAVDVLVVGAGPAGLTLAADLLRRDISVRLIDQARAASSTSRATSLTPRTLEVLDDLGVARKLLGTGIRITRAEAYQGSRPTFRLAFPASDRTRFPFLLNNSQQQTERVLTELVQQLGGRVERARTLTAFRQERGGVVAHVGGPTGAEEIHASWLVGADGGRSTVRRTLGIPFRGKGGLEETIVLADVLMDWDRAPDRLYTWFNEDGALLAFPFRERGRWRLTAALSPAEEAAGRYTEESIEQFTHLYRRRTGDDVTQLMDLTGFSVYRVNQRVVDHYRRGRALLAGDAAHIHTPAGGLGMNTGIQDAYNLGWRLALAVRNGDVTVVDGYERERRPVAEALLSSTGGLQRLYSIRDRRVQRARDVALQLVVNAGPTREAFF